MSTFHTDEAAGVGVVYAKLILGVQDAYDSLHCTAVRRG